MIQQADTENSVQPAELFEEHRESPVFKKRRVFLPAGELLCLFKVETVLELFSVGVEDGQIVTGR